ncbi:hypothetical protein ABT010_29050 [Streptomyces sp. NPDC002668]|uniref:hypothetical protein n=1 Tax=Streptomyces sp. NPDC002668 TaxID=3154422 RepID=UPI0033323AD4
MVRADAANNRLPRRGTAFVTDDYGGAIVTGLSRLAYEPISKERGPRSNSAPLLDGSLDIMSNPN